MKILALDIGDKWTGIALSDPLGIIARPYKTVDSKELHTALSEIISQESIATVVVGLPTTLRGTESEQTKKVKATTKELETLFPNVTWVLWDERFTSKQAEKIKAAKTKEQKLASHAIAAALILDSYLSHLRFKKEILDNAQ